MVSLENKFPHTNGKTVIKQNKNNWLVCDWIVKKELVVNGDFVEIFKLCNGKISFEEICNIISKKKNLNLTETKKLITSVLLDLEKHRLIRFSNIAKSVPIKVIKNKQKYPLNYVYLEVTKKCNFSCIHCYAGVPSLNRENKIGKELTTSDYFYIIDQLDDLGVVFIYITGGEPFLRSDIFDILSYINSKNIGFSVLTNGYYLNKKKIRKLKSLNIDSLLISFDSCDKEKYGYIRGKGKYDRVLRNIFSCINYGLHVRVGSVLFKGINDSYEHLKKHLAFLKSKGLDIGNITFDEFIPQGEGKNKEYLRVNEKEVMANLKRACSEVFPGSEHINSSNSVKNITSNTFCGVGVEMLYIDSKGDVFLCPGLSNEEYRIGNLFVKRLKTIWKNSKLFKYFRNKDYLSKSKCRLCTRFKDCLGGCKARSLALQGKFEAEDPWMCAYYDK